jgi:predicted XRE-type DNA-binding protein
MVSKRSGSKTSKKSYIKKHKKVSSAQKRARELFAKRQKKISKLVRKGMSKAEAQRIVFGK